jgi:hypothetical protein
MSFIHTFRGNDSSFGKWFPSSAVRWLNRRSRQSGGIGPVVAERRGSCGEADMLALQQL